MNFKMTQQPPEGPGTGSPAMGSSGFAGRVESAARARAPAPKGKGIVMLIVGAAVLGALIWDFTRESGASRAVRNTVTDPTKPVAPTGPDEAPDGKGNGAPPPVAPLRATGPLQISMKTPEGPDLDVTPAAAARLIATAREDQRKTLRRGALEALIRPSEAPGRRGRLAFEAATRFLVDAGPECKRAVSNLTLRAFKALTDDEVAPAAILFLSRLPGRGGALIVDALDEIIRSQERPLHVRLAAARARPAEGREDALKEFFEEPSAHPALLELLGR